MNEAAEPAASIRLQRTVGWILAPLWVPLLVGTMRFGLAWRIEDAHATRALYRRLRRESDAPLMICANHLTMLDSFVIAWALGGPLAFLRDYGALPWNTPERTHFADSWWKRIVVYLAKCIPITRGGERDQLALALARVRSALDSGDAVLMFPEGGRSRSGRVDAAGAAWGIGRIVRTTPGCRVLCVYLRGEGQETWSEAPRRGERFRVEACTIEPKSDHGGLRGSVEVSRQILAKLAEMESRHFDAIDAIGARGRGADAGI